MAKLTKSTKPIRMKDIKDEWCLVDAKDKILGRLATQIAKLLEGKDKVNYVPYLNSGSKVVVLNTNYLLVTGRKEDQKKYQRYSGYPGGLKTRSYRQQMEKDSTEILRRAVSGMLPKNKLRKRRLARLFILPEGNNPFKDKFKVVKK